MQDECCASARSATAEPDVHRWLADALESARRAWPAILIDDDVFVRHVLAKVDALPGPLARSTFHTDDLYLACACLSRNPLAFARFEQACLDGLDRALLRILGTRASAEDLKSALREKLFFPEFGPPLIASFAGRSDLRRWVRTVATHAAFKLRRKEARGTGIADPSELPLDGDDAELTYLRRQYAIELEAALARALKSLAARERGLMQQHFVDGLNADAIAKLHGVHRATVARWIAHARTLVANAVTRDLVERLSMSPCELEGVVSVACGSLDGDLSELLSGPT